ncbi:MAG: heme o synthase [Chlamydiales bacterium]
MINYYLLTKPGIIVGNLLTVAAGFLIASHHSFNVLLFAATLLGLAFIMASACIFNNFIDRKIDQKMNRTKNRALAKGLISGQKAILFASLLGSLGILILLYYTNGLATLIALFGFFVYVVLYSMWKGRTIYGTAIGSIAGAVPPVVGYCAVSHQFDMGAVILFTMLVLWQMPHFFAIAIVHFEDYAAASISVFPVIKGMRQTKLHMMLYTIGFLIAATLLATFKFAGQLYFFAALILGLAWILLSLLGFKNKNDKLWAKQMFRLSLIIITILCLVIPIERVL